MSQRKIFSETAKKCLYAHYNGKCAICGKHIKYKRMTIDHIVPLSQGGTDDYENLQLACHACNRMKNDFMEDQFYKHLRKVFFHHLWVGTKEFFVGKENV